MDYLIFHCVYTVPCAALLTIAYRPFFTQRDAYKICTLSAIAVIATVPWDSYLIRTKIWSYPTRAVTGYTLYEIPLEEVFFFIIQTYITGVLYCALSKPLVLPTYLQESSNLRRTRNVGATCLLSLFLVGISCLLASGTATYLGLILIWASPVLMIQWLISYTFFAALPWMVLLVPVCLPTLFLWIADANAIHAGTWVIENGTKLDFQLWRGLEVEEAIFFLLTNVMVVGGLVSCDYVFALEEYRILCSPAPSGADFSLRCALTGLFNQPGRFDEKFTGQLSQAVTRLGRASQSMFIGSTLFEGNLRIDLIYLYLFCRVMDDLVDSPGNAHAARYWIESCSKELKARDKCRITVPEAVPPQESTKLRELQSCISLLPLQRLSTEPLFELLRGFETDLLFDHEQGQFPIHTDTELDLYAYRVAGTVATSLLELVYHHQYRNIPVYPPDYLVQLTQSGSEMGKALQCVNIARDIARDAASRRVYIPTSWLEEVGLTPAEVIRDPTSPKVQLMQQKMLDRADHYYQSSVAAIAQLPNGIRQPIRATVESYMEIARVLKRRKGGWLRGEKLSLPLWRRLVVVWLAMSST